MVLKLFCESEPPGSLSFVEGGQMIADTDRIATSAAPVVEGCGCELVEVRRSVQNGDETLTFVIYKKGGVSMEDCERVHNALDPFLDDLDPSGGEPYVLQVSSMGLDRKLVSDDDFRRRLGEELVLSLKGSGRVSGFLTSFDSSSVTLSLTDKRGKSLNEERSFDRKEIKSAAAAIRFD